MISLRDVLIFLAGAAFLHTISHILFAKIVPLPFDLKFMVLSSNMNMWIIVLSAVVTILLLWWAARLSKRK